MPKCDVCDSEVTPEQKTCHVCGSPTSNDTGSLDGGFPLPTYSLGLAASAASPLSALLMSASSDQLQCPGCGRLFDASVTDDFCPCGTELLVVLEPVEVESPELPLPPIDFPLPLSSPTSSPTPTIPLAVPITLIVSEPVLVSTVSAKPAAGTVCLVLYSDTKPRQPLKYFAINKDVTLIGRLDAVSSVFPDVELSAHFGCRRFAKGLAEACRDSALA